MEALQAGRDIDKILIKKDRQGNELLRELHDLLRGRMIPVQHVPVERLNRITRKNHQGVIAFVAEITYQRIEDIVPAVYEQGRDGLYVLLDGVTDVRNFGAIARTCECVGVDALVIPTEGSASVSRSTQRRPGLSGAEPTQRPPIPARQRRASGGCHRKSEHDVHRHHVYRSHGDRDGCRGHRSGARAPQAVRRVGAHPATRNNRLPERLGGRRRIALRGPTPAWIGCTAVQK